MFCAGTELTGTVGTAFSRADTGVLMSIPVDTVKNPINSAVCDKGSQLTIEARSWSTTGTSDSSLGAVEGVCFGTLSTTLGTVADHDALGETDTVAMAVTTVKWTYT
jgi:hypothetical protein